MYKIKQIPEDFIVEEVASHKISEKGDYSIFLMKKKDWNTLDAIKEIAKQLCIKENRLGFAGIKDKRAITTQYVSAYKVSKEKIESVKIKDIELKYLGKSESDIGVGDLDGNKFGIVVRNIKNGAIPKKSAINYFDEQRFGEGKNNHIIGKFLLKKKYPEALKLINEKIANEYLERYQNDYVGALKRISEHQLLFYVHSYTSYLWNEVVCEYVKRQGDYYIIKYSLGELAFPKREIPNQKIPVLGFGIEIEEINNSAFKEIIYNIMQKEEISLRDFVNKQINYLSVSGDLRDLIFEIENLDIGNLEDDELNLGMKKQLLSFFLKKGSYATISIKNLFQS